jgi:hypothetical protein
MARLAVALLVRMGLVLLVLAVGVRLLPMPDRADVVADDFAIAVSLALVLAASIFLRLTRNAAARAERPGKARYPTSAPRTPR